MASRVDDKEVLENFKRLQLKARMMQRKATMDVASEVLRLSTFEVPHDKGLLQASGAIERDGDNAIVGFNKVYAARLHEHPEYRFQKGRKGKYLEDPIKHNLRVFVKFIKQAVEGGIAEALR